MPYDPALVVESYQRNAEAEDKSAKERSRRVEIPRGFIKKYLKPSDVVLDAGGGLGIKAIVMAGRCAEVTLLDITPGIPRMDTSAYHEQRNHELLTRFATECLRV